MDLVSISTGDILRNAIAMGTPVGKQAKPFMDFGKYVPDQLVNDIIAERFSRDGLSRFVMDGYPRTMAQAEAFDAMLQRMNLHLDRVVLIDVPYKEVVERITGRRVHIPSGRIYHLKYKPPLKEGLDDLTGEPLTHRPDDTEIVIRERLRIFRDNTLGLIDRYRERHLFRAVNGVGTIEEVTQEILDALE